MYKVLLDNTLMYDPRIEELALIKPIVKLEENKAGSFTFTIPPKHPRYDDIKKRKSIIQVYRNEEEEPIFSGMCIEATIDFYKQKAVTCEGELSYFNDTVQRPARYQNISVRGLLEAYVSKHNEQVEKEKQFAVGMVTVQDNNDSLYRYTNMQTTMTELKEDLIDDLGGFFRIRHVNGVKYLDYLADSQNTCKQEIRLGENLLDFTTNLDTSNLATAIIPLGQTLEVSPVEGLDGVKLTIESVNSGKDYVYSEDAVKAFGWIYKTVEWSGVTTPQALKRKGEKYLKETQFENMVIEAKAIDLSLIDKSLERFKLSDSIRVVSKPHGLDKFFRLTRQTINLQQSENDAITLGKEEFLSLSAKTAQTYEEIRKAIESITPASSILESAKKNATALITTAMGGYVYKTNSELYIMDTDSPKTAQRVWRWNISGLGYSKNGVNGPYGLAMTMDGAIVADFITTGALSASLIKGGTFKVGGKNNGNGIIELYDASGKKIATLDVNGLNVEKGKISGNLVKGGTIIGSEFQNKDTKENSSFYVTANGYMHASDGDIGGLKISQTKIYSDREDGTSISSTSVIGGGSVLSSSGIQSYMSTSKLVSSDGYGLKASGADIVPVGNPTLGSREHEWQTMYAQYVWAGGLGLQTHKNDYGNGDAVIEGSLTVEGTKSRSVNTRNFGKRKLHAYETPTPMFGDVGDGVIDETGTCYVSIDDVFFETVSDCKYQVFLQAYGNGSCYVGEMNSLYFTVKGSPGLKFAWEIKAVQIDANLIRLEAYEKEDVINNLTELQLYVEDIERDISSIESEVANDIFDSAINLGNLENEVIKDITEAA